MTTETRDDWFTRSREIGAGAMEAIADMVAALECDFDRLEELREERSDWVDNVESDDAEQRTAADWAAEFPEEAGELHALEAAAGDCESREEAEQRIQDDPLSLEVRSGWTVAGHDLEAEEFCLTLATGGPAVRIVGEIRDGAAYRPRLEVQDWFQPWTEVPQDTDALETYCGIVCCFDC